MKYSETHEWIEIEGSVGTVGITRHAEKQLGDIVYVELPKSGKQVKAGEEVAVLESTKAAADIYSPVSGTILEINESLKTRPEWINEDPEKGAWIYKIQLSDLLEVEKLMDITSYELLIK
ncbi:MAG: glycine cleavage system protein GcvH [Parachlamydiaceae bacterium]